jgi:hypothetical protein
MWGYALPLEVLNSIEELGFNQHTLEGWQVVALLTPELAQGAWSAKTGSMVAFL